MTPTGSPTETGEPRGRGAADAAADAATAADADAAADPPMPPVDDRPTRLARLTKQTVSDRSVIFDTDLSRRVELPAAVRSLVCGDLDGYEVRERLAEGDLHDVFGVVDGSGTEYVLKIAADTDRDRQRVAHEAAVVESLRTHEFVPGVVRSGVTDSHAYALFERVEGHERWGDARWESAAARTLGETLRRLHTSAERHEGWNERGHADTAPTDRVNAAVADALYELHAGDRRELTGVVTDAAAVIRETSPAVGVTHGDVTVGNVLFGADAESCTLVDWETAAWFDAYFDAAKAELWLFQLFSPLFSLPESSVVAAFREAYGASTAAVRRIQAYKLLQLCRMVPRIERLGPYTSWERRLDASCLAHVESVLERTIRECSFLSDPP